MRDDAEAVLRVMCVDDNRDTADSLMVLLELAGFDVVARYDGPSAVDTAETFLPEVCVLDLNMPGMAGEEVGRRVRAGASGPDTLLVALTGLPEDEARRRSAAAGFDLHLTKPIDPDVLANTLIDILILRAPLNPNQSTRIAMPGPRKVE